MLIVQHLIWLSLLLLLAAASAEQYECFPYPVKSMCMIDFVYYHPGEPITFPLGYDHYWITSRSEKLIESNVTIFDDALYEAMHRPTHIEMTHTGMENLTLPPELQLGNFASNRIYSVTVKIRRNYQISYLDMSNNNLKEVAFVSNLVNLETLHLEHNNISTITGSMLTPLTKLKFINIKYNVFTSIPWTDLPRTLIHLDCFHNRVISAEFTNVSLPSLDFVDLQCNRLTTLNVTALLLVAPYLKEANLLNEEMSENEINQTKATLTLNNISFVNTFYPKKKYCFTRDGLVDYIDGKCVLPVPLGTGMAILMSGVVIGMAAMFAYIVMLTFKHMNR